MLLYYMRSGSLLYLSPREEAEVVYLRGWGRLSSVGPERNTECFADHKEFTSRKLEAFGTLGSQLITCS